MVLHMTDGWRTWLHGQGDIERARSLMAIAFPEFLQDQVEIAVDEYDPLAAIVFAAILDANGETLNGGISLLAGAGGANRHPAPDSW